MKAKHELDRRSFIKASLAAGGALVFGFHVPATGRAAQRLGLPTKPAADFQPNAFIRIAPDGKVAVTVGQMEMGQGVFTSLPMIVADELEVDWANVSYVPGGADKELARPPRMAALYTGGSSSVSSYFEPLRRSAAAAREMLIAAAAAQLNVAPESLHAENGSVIHSETKRALTYGSLLEAASKLTPPAQPKLKDPKDFKIIGKKVLRLDSPEKTNGTAVFGIDVKVPGMLTATVLRPPVFGGKAGTVDDTAAKAVKGVRMVIPVESGVAVLADNYWAAKKGRDALKVQWDNGQWATQSSDAIFKSFADAAENEKGMSANKTGDAVAARSSAAKTVDAVYFAPFLAHATMEPMNFTADVRPDSCELWGGVQAQLGVQQTAAKATGLPPEKVVVHPTLLGGGFGRRFEQDYVLEAVLLSKAAGKPVKVIWTREDDMQHDFYRPATYNKMSAGVDAAGKPVFWSHRIVNTAIGARGVPNYKPERPDGASVEGAADLPYAIPNIQVDWIHKDAGVPVGYWRSVGSSHTAFSTECFIDELATLAGKDPLEFRLALLEKHPRHVAVLKLAAEKAGWNTKPAAGVGRGIAVHESFRSYVAQVAEVTIGKDGKPRVERVICAVDCGQVVNPDTVAAQMEGGIVYGLTAALYGDITLKDGRVQQRNFNDYKMLRMNEMPKVEVYIVPSTEKHGGVGEPGTPPIAPAVCNAIFTLTGKRIRTLPIKPSDLVAKAG